MRRAGRPVPGLTRLKYQVLRAAHAATPARSAHATSMPLPGSCSRAHVRPGAQDMTVAMMAWAGARGGQGSGVWQGCGGQARSTHAVCAALRTWHTPLGSGLGPPDALPDSFTVSSLKGKEKYQAAHRRRRRTARTLRAVGRPQERVLAHLPQPPEERKGGHHLQQGGQPLGARRHKLCVDREQGAEQGTARGRRGARRKVGVGVGGVGNGCAAHVALAAALRLRPQPQPQPPQTLKP